jgi:hypothetical protein
VIPGLLAVSKYLSLYGIVIKRVGTLFCAGLFSLVVFILNDLRITDAEMQFFDTILSLTLHSDGFC